MSPLQHGVAPRYLCATPQHACNCSTVHAHATDKRKPSCPLIRPDSLTPELPRARQRVRMMCPECNAAEHSKPTHVCSFALCSRCQTQQADIVQLVRWVFATCVVGSLQNRASGHTCATVPSTASGHTFALFALASIYWLIICHE